MKLFVESLKLACKILKREFIVNDQDSEFINFEIDKYRFTMHVGEEEQKIGFKSVTNELYSLCVWHTINNYSRDTPPEDVDTQLIKTYNLNECIKCVLETVAKEEIRQALENVFFELNEAPTEEETFPVEASEYYKELDKPKKLGRMYFND